MLLQIHDELVFESPQDELKNIIPIIKTEMTEVTSNQYYSLSTPLTVDINSGENWGLAH